MKFHAVMGGLLSAALMLGIPSANAQTLNQKEVWDFGKGSLVPCGKVFVSDTDVLAGRLCNNPYLDGKPSTVQGYFTYDTLNAQGASYAPLTLPEVDNQLRAIVGRRAVDDDVLGRGGFTAVDASLFSLSSDKKTLIKSPRSRTSQTTIHALSGEDASFAGIPSVIKGDDGYLYAPIRRKINDRCTLTVLRFLPSGEGKSELPAGKFPWGKCEAQGQLFRAVGLFDGSLIGTASDVTATDQGSDTLQRTDKLILLPLFATEREFKTLNESDADSLGTNPFIPLQPTWTRADGRLYTGWGDVPFTAEYNGGYISTAQPLGSSEGRYGTEFFYFEPTGAVVATHAKKLYALTKYSYKTSDIEPAAVLFELTPPSPTLPNVKSFTLVNAVTGEELQGYRNIKGRVVLSLSALPAAKLGVKANVDTSATQSVVFGLRENVQFQIDNAPPFSLFGGASSPYYSWTPQRGTYPITAKAYLKTHGGGSSGTGASLSLVFIP